METDKQALATLIVNGVFDSANRIIKQKHLHGDAAKLTEAIRSEVKTGYRDAVRSLAESNKAHLSAKQIGDIMSSCYDRMATSALQSAGILK